MYACVGLRLFAANLRKKKLLRVDDFFENHYRLGEISLTRPRNFPWPPKKFPWAVYQVFLGVVVGGVGGIKKIWRNLRYATRMLNCDNKEFA